MSTGLVQDQTLWSDPIRTNRRKCVLEGEILRTEFWLEAWPLSLTYRGAPPSPCLTNLVGFPNSSSRASPPGLHPKGLASGESVHIGLLRPGAPEWG